MPRNTRPVTILESISQLDPNERLHAAQVLATLKTIGYIVETGEGERQEYVNVRNADAKHRTLSMSRTTGRIQFTGVKAAFVARELGFDVRVGATSISFGLSELAVDDIVTLVVLIDEAAS